MRDLRDLRGVAYVLGRARRRDELRLPERRATEQTHRGSGGSQPHRGSSTPLDDAIVLPSFEEVKADKLAFAEATRLIHINTNPLNAKTLVQYPRPPGRGGQSADAAAVARRRWIASTICPTRAGRTRPTREPIPAYEMIKDSVTIMRGCFGGCTFCSITAHQGRIIQSRSQESVLGEVRKMAADPEFKGVVSDIGGPTANMYQMRCTPARGRGEVQTAVVRASDRSASCSAPITAR